MTAPSKSIAERIRDVADNVDWRTSPDELIAIASELEEEAERLRQRPLRLRDSNEVADSLAKRKE